jgi:hypothetical protein
VYQEKKDNDFLIDRESQKHEKFTGIKSIVAEDVAVLSNRDTAIVDRTDELLVSSDRAIITLRKRLIRGAKALVEGTEPSEAASPEAYRVRALDIILPHDVPLAEGAPELYRPREHSALAFRSFGGEPRRVRNAINISKQVGYRLLCLRALVVQQTYRLAKSARCDE